jgi:hypothetical protein
MRRRKRLTRLGWRWRRNSLRRRTDVVESWLVMITAVLFCAAPAVGWWAGQSVDRTLQRVVRTQRAERTLVTATVRPAGSSASDLTVSSSGVTKSSVAEHGDLLRWTGPDHSVHSATVSSDLEVWHRGKILLWTDHKGVIVAPPLDPATAVTHSVLAGIAASSATAGLLLITRQLLMWRLMLRRMASWQREWDRFGQDWGRAGAGG